MEHAIVKFKCPWKEAPKNKLKLLAIKEVLQTPILFVLKLPLKEGYQKGWSAHHKYMNFCLSLFISRKHSHDKHKNLLTRHFIADA